MAGGTVIYADAAQPDDSGNGSSWTTAKKTLQAAVDLSASYGGSQVWVRQGRYAEVRTAAYGALVMKSGVELYGGFAGTETALAQRDAAAHPTIISDAGSAAYFAGYSNTVLLSGVNHCRLDGFTISDGNGGYDEYYTYANSSYGGGIYCAALGSSVVIANCTITNNWAAGQGGGLYVKNSPLALENCIITGNRPEGIYAFQSLVSITSCTVARNNSTGIRLFYCDPGCTVRNCLVEGNRNNAGIDLSGTSALVADCLVRDNDGSGVYCFENSPTLLRCRIDGNRATRGGGVNSTARTTLINCLLTGNTATDSGGAVCCETTPTLMMNCTVTGNRAPKGGGYSCGSLALRFDAVITNTIFSANTGQAVYESSGRGDPALQSCLFFGNPDGDYRDADTSRVLTGAAALNALINYSGSPNAGTVDGDPRLDAGGMPAYSSAAIDRGTDSGTPATDIAGRPRPVDIPGLGIDGSGPTVDIGAWEAQASDPAVIDVQPAALDFGLQSVGAGPTASRDLTLINTGFSPLTFTSATLALGGDHPEDFSTAGSGASFRIDPGTSHTLQAAFDPNRSGPTSATLRIATGNPDHPTLTVSLRGHGMAAAPVAASEPAFTPGTGNTIAWTPVAGATGYAAQCAASADFAVIQASRNLPAGTSSAAFTSLAHGRRYWFRVRIVDAWGQPGEWSEPVASTQDGVAPAGSLDILETVTSQTTVHLALDAADDTSGSGVAALRLSNDNRQWTDWAPPTSATTWMLAPGSAVRTVYAQFRDAVGNVSPSVSDTGISLPLAGPRAKRVRSNIEEVSKNAAQKIMVGPEHHRRPGI